MVLWLHLHSRRLSASGVEGAGVGCSSDRGPTEGVAAVMGEDNEG